MALALTQKVKTAPEEDADNAYLKEKMQGRLSMKGIEFVLLAVGAVVGAFLRYRFVESSIT